MDTNELLITLLDLIQRKEGRIVSLDNSCIGICINKLDIESDSLKRFDKLMKETFLVEVFLEEYYIKIVPKCIIIDSYALNPDHNGKANTQWFEKIIDLEDSSLYEQLKLSLI